MNYFGIIALLIVVAAGAWWGGKNFSSSPAATDGEGTYQKTIESAKDVVNQVSKKTEQQLDEALTANDNMVTVYDGISVSENSETLNLTGKGLTGSLKAEVRQLTNLRELNLSNNKFTGVPAEVGQLSKLEVLNLSQNPITGLPQEIGNLKNLKTLDLRGTNYAKQDLEVIKKNLPATTKILID
jgi:Leucine-rich repeat (LRR) protein